MKACGPEAGANGVDSAVPMGLLMTSAAVLAGATFAVGRRWGDEHRHRLADVDQRRQVGLVGGAEADVGGDAEEVEVDVGDALDQAFGGQAVDEALADRRVLRLLGVGAGVVRGHFDGVGHARQRSM